MSGQLVLQKIRIAIVRGSAAAVAAIAFVVATGSPAQAAKVVNSSADLQWLVDAVTSIQNGFIAAGWAIVVVGVAFGGLHFAEHREDWYGAIKRVAACVVAGGIMMHASDLAGLAAAGAIVPHFLVQ